MDLGTLTRKNPLKYLKSTQYFPMQTNVPYRLRAQRT
jgi:hypothetical protein